MRAERQPRRVRLFILFALVSPLVLNAGTEDLAPLLRSHLATNKFPALAAAVVRGTNVIAAGIAGVRKAGSEERARIDDKFHIGSCTKSITALLAVYLDSEGVVRLTNTMSDILVDWKLPETAKSISLELLLQNRSGLGNEPDSKVWRRAFMDSGEPAKQRRHFLEEFLKTPSAAKPGEKYIYSNPGYSLAGAMLEVAAKKSWEDLVLEKIFAPLKLTNAGFGPPSSTGKVDQPWGHEWEDGKAVPAAPMDNPMAIAPAGAVHMTILECARYAAFHLQAAQGKVPALRPYREALYTAPKAGSYGFGWIVAQRPWARGKVLSHAGSNTIFYTVIWIAPEIDLAFVVSTNVGDRGDFVAQGCDAVVGHLIERFVIKQDAH